MPRDIKAVVSTSSSRKLNTDDNAGLPVDGTFGPLTQQAVINFQQEMGSSRLTASWDRRPRRRSTSTTQRERHHSPGLPKTSVPAVNLDNCPTLAEGYQGGCVNQLQSELNTDDNAGLPVDGTFGPLTQQAVINFQQGNGSSRLTASWDRRPRRRSTSTTQRVFSLSPTRRAEILVRRPFAYADISSLAAYTIAIRRLCSSPTHGPIRCCRHC